MPVLLPEVRLQVAQDGAFQSSRMVLPPTTDRLLLRLKRPTAADTGTIFSETTRASLTITVRGDSESLVFSGSATGGIRNRVQSQQEIDWYEVEWLLPWGFFGDRAPNDANLMPRRYGEGKSVFDVIVDLSVTGGALDSLLEIEHTISPAPRRPFHSSVAFDASSSATETAGDGAISVSHTASGSDRAAFVGTGFVAEATGTNTGTYGGVSMTEEWDTATSFTTAAGYSYIAPAASSQSVAITGSDGAPESQFVQVITFTGVHQTTATGTAVTATGTGTSLSVSVSAPASDSIIADFVIASHNATNTLTVGADQTQRQNDVIGNTRAGCSTQLGSAGAAMSWTFTGSNFGSVLGAVEFLASGAGGGGRIMSSLAGYGGLAGHGGIAGMGGGLAG